MIARTCLALTTICIIAALPTAAWARQAADGEPRVQIGVNGSAFLEPGRSNIGTTPQLSWNFAANTALQVSADFRPTIRRSYFTEREELAVINLKRTLFRKDMSRFFVTVGGAVGRLRFTQLPSSYMFSDRTVTLPGGTSSWPIGGMTVGAGFDRTLGSHVAINVETQLALRNEPPVARAIAGVAVPVGRFRRAAMKSPIATAFKELNVGQTVWITTDDGLQWKGVVRGASATSIEFVNDKSQRTMSLSRITKIETTDRIRDGATRGAIIGAAGGGVPVFIVTAAICANEGCRGSTILYGLAWTGIGAGVGSCIGALADSLHEGRRTIYERNRESVLRVTPIVSRHTAGIGATIRW